jgi:hypothetical protein
MFMGECRASDTAFQPDEDRTRQVCNLGYGRGRCERFPNDAAADAIRFHVSEDAGELIRIQYVFEKDWWPGEHGVLECSSTRRPISSEPGDEILRRQAASFAESYVRRRS